MSRHRLVFLAITGLLLASLHVVPTAQAVVPGANGLIAFTSIRDGNREIYVMNADGSDQRNLTNNPAWDMMPAWSPDGTKIAFSTYRDGDFDIYVMNADGSGQTNLSNNTVQDFYPRWSPDGTKIAYQYDPSSDGTAPEEIYVMNADGSGQANLTNNPARDSSPAWSPDGTKIAFATDREGDNEIYLMNPDGTGQTNLSNNHLGGDGAPAWSPDGTKIVFGSDRGSNGYEIYVMNADGTGPVNLTNNNWWADGTPAWSPDGTKIVFFSDRDGNFEIYVMNADGSGQTNLTNNPAFEDTPSWQAAALPTVDVTPPEITITTPAESADYMQGDFVVADFECTDAESGIASCEGSIAWGNESVPMVDGQPIDTNRLSTVIGPNATWTVTATDNAGNTQSAHGHYYVIDPEPFTGRFVVNISTEPDGLDQYMNGWGWKHGPVTIYLGGWGNPIGTAPIAEGGFGWRDEVSRFNPGDTVQVMDAVGNYRSLLVANLAVTDIDGVTGHVAGTCDVGMNVNIEYSTDDAHPNPTQLEVPCDAGTFEASFSQNELPNYPEGSYVEARQWDDDGDGTQVDAWYPQYLSYWLGFFRPVDNQPTFNTVKAGQAIPVKFSLGGDQGLNIFAAGYPGSLQIDCNTAGDFDAVEQTVAGAGGSSLQYDALTDTYTYVWKTDKAWAGTCRQLNVTLLDGTSHKANFKFTK